MPTLNQATAIEWAVMVMADPTTVFLDCETTGVDGDAEVIELAVVSAAGRVLLDRLIAPRRGLRPEAAAVNGIGAGELLDAPTLPDVWTPRLARNLGRSRVVAWNAPFDRRLLIQSCAAWSLDPGELAAAEWQCAMRVHAAFAGVVEARPGRRSTNGPWRCWRLSEAARTLGVDPGGHRALADAMTCRAIVAAMAVEGRREE